MLSVRASASNSAFDNPNPKRRKRDLDGSHKGFERALIDAYGRDTRVRVSQSQTETNFYPSSRYPQQPSWNNPSQPLSQSSQRIPYAATSLSSRGERIPPAVHSSVGLQNQRSQGPSSQFVMPVPSLGLRPVNVYSSHPPLPPAHSTFALQNQRNEVHSSSNEPSSVMPVASSGLRPVNAHNPYPPPSRVHSNFPLQSLRNQGHRTSNYDFQSVMPVALVGLRPPVDVKNFHPPPEHASFTLQNQRSSNTVKNQGSYIANGPLLSIQNSGPVASSKQPGISPYSGLLGSLLAGGVISLPSETPRQDSLGVEFKADPRQDSLGVEFKSDLPKVRNESVISALYGNRLPPSKGVLPIQNSRPVFSRNQPGISAYSGLLCSLMAQGVISLPKQTPQQESLGVEFKKDLLKVRHESVISALYGDMPRQCSTCGHRFKCQEEHRKHMDWHVIKNRMSKSCTKKKQMQSRMWFVDTSMWLIACPAEAAGPQFKTETIVEKKKSDEETAVPADGDQTSCVLCGEAFDDFYSDVTEDWMYKDATFLNAPDHRSTEGMDRSELGPIVHALCISDGSLRKRLRTS